MKFIHKFIQALKRKSFYSNVLNNKESIGFGYLFKLEIIATLFIVVIISINISSVLPTLDKKARELLPVGAEIIIKDGVLRTNVNPIIIPMPNGVVGKAAEIKNFLVLDVTTALKRDDLVEKDALILINGEGIISRTDGVNTETTRFSEIPGLNIMLDQEWVINKATWIREHAKYVPFLLFTPILVGFYLLALFWSLVYGLFAYILLKVHGAHKSFRVAFSVGLYSRTFSLVLSLFMLIIPFLNIALLAIPLNLFFIYSMLKPHFVHKVKIF